MNELTKTRNMMAKAVIPDKTPLEEIECLNMCQAEKLTKICRNVFYTAMDKYQKSHGKVGLAFVTPSGSSRRLVRRSSLRRWLEEQERIAAYA